MTIRLSIVYSRANNSIHAPLVTVEVHLSNGLPSFSMVGLPEKAVKESKDRVRSAIMTNGFDFPTRRITVNLAPADLPKESGRFDLAIAIGILVASEQLPGSEITDYEFAGELSLSGELRSAKGMLPFAIQTAKAKRRLIFPAENEMEVALINQGEHYIAKHFIEVTKHFQKIEPLSKIIPITSYEKPNTRFDLGFVKGQHQAKRALEIAASGQHNLLFRGPPGTGKTLLASCLPSILPPLSESDALALAAIMSLTHKGFNPNTWRQHAFRHPHHSASSVALIGGGNPPKPGEISLAHAGVLFLDELPEFNRHVLEALREPLESGLVTISRATRQTEFPASFQLIAAMNPCPCGYYLDEKGDCHCSQEQVTRYHHKISGPLLDRIDLHIDVPRISLHQYADENPETSEVVQERVIASQNIQRARQGKLNTHLPPEEIHEHCQLSPEDQEFFIRVCEKKQLSTRAYHRVLKVSRTIADLAGEEFLQKKHIAEAFAYRMF